MIRALDRINRAVEYICAALMILLTVETLYVVVMRYGFNNTPYWGEVISRFLMVYACMFGFSIGIHDNSLVSIRALDRFLPGAVLRALDWLGILGMLLFSVFMIVEGINYTILCRGNTISGLNIRSCAEMVCIPIGGLFCLLQSIRRAILMRRST